jgi:hypothetical protein
MAKVEHIINWENRVNEAECKRIVAEAQSKDNTVREATNEELDEEILIKAPLENPADAETYSARQCEFVKADTPNWTNWQFIEFFKNTYPEMKKKPLEFYINKW